MCRDPFQGEISLVIFAALMSDPSLRIVNSQDHATISLKKSPKGDATFAFDRPDFRVPAKTVL